MEQNRKVKEYDLEERTFSFAGDVRVFVKEIPKSMANIEDGRQLIRSSGSIGANYIEANEALSKKDFAMRIKICRKEAKESAYWLRLIDISDKKELEQELNRLVSEARQLTRIFGAILNKT